MKVILMDGKLPSNLYKTIWCGTITLININYIILMHSIDVSNNRSRASAYPNVQLRTETLIKSPTPERIKFSPIVAPNSGPITPARHIFSPIVVPNSKPQTQSKIFNYYLTNSITNIKDMINDVAKNYKKEKRTLDGFMNHIRV